MAKMRDILDSEEARANREANIEVEGAWSPEEDPADDPAADPVIHVEDPQDDPGTATVGPLGAFFKRRADFFEQEATMLAIQLEHLYQKQKNKE